MHVPARFWISILLLTALAGEIASAAPARRGSAGTGAAAAAVIAKIEQQILHCASVETAVHRGLIRRYGSACIEAGIPQRGLQVLGPLFEKALPPPNRSLFMSRRIRALAAVGDTLVFLAFWQRSNPGSAAAEPEFLGWLMGPEERYRALVDILQPEDDFGAAVQILARLFRRDPAHRDRFFPLMLAIAVVWDKPRPPMHRQMGAGPPGPLPSPVEVYDYFLALYRSHDARIAFRRIPASALVYVVDIPAALSELEWARRHVSGDLSGWKRKFSEIHYDAGRIRRRRFNWPHGRYTLAGIRRYGGICVDQAYYAVLTARAFGIPAMMFAGEGRRGPHAWFGYMTAPDKWVTDVGRYRYDKYATGVTYDPQTGRQLTDHDLALVYHRTMRTPHCRDAAVYTRLASLCFALKKTRLSQAFAGAAVSAYPLYYPAWRLLEKTAERNGNRALLSVLDREARVFRDYPDVVAFVRKRQAGLLQRSGRARDADRLLRRSESRLRNRRDDLGRYLGMAQVRQALTEKNPVQARRKLENILRKNRNEGRKVAPLVETYLNLTKQTGQSRAALRFLRNYLPAMERRVRGEPWWGAPTFTELLARAYENAGDSRRAAQIRKRARKSGTR